MNYTIAEHSGFGRAATEVYAVTSDRDLNALRAAGAIVVPDYAVAERIAEEAFLYPSPDAVAPCGVRGTFSTFRWRGMAVLEPDPFLRVLLSVAAAADWGGDLDEWTVAARALTSPDADARASGRVNV